MTPDRALILDLAKHVEAGLIDRGDRALQLLDTPEERIQLVLAVLTRVAAWAGGATSALMGAEKPPTTTELLELLLGLYQSPHAAGAS